MLAVEEEKLWTSGSILYFYVQKVSRSEYWPREMMAFFLACDSRFVARSWPFLLFQKTNNVQKISR